MKIFITLATALLLSGCKSKEAASPSEPIEKTEEQVRALLTERATLLTQKHRLQKQLNRIVSTSKVDPSGEMKLVFTEKQQAVIALQTIRNTHPNLQKLNQDLQSWQSRQHSASSSQRPSEAEAAHRKIVEITGKIHSLSKELPVIREAEDRIQRSEQKIEELRRSFAEKTPEGQDLIAKIKAVDEKIAAMK